MTTDVAADLIAPVQAYMDALKAQDIERVLSLFTEDGSLMANEAPTAVGGEQLRATFTHFFTMLQLDRDLHVDECFAEGSIGFVRSHTTGSMTIRATKTRMELESRELFVLQRSDASWRIRCYMFNAPAAAK